VLTRNAADFKGIPELEVLGYGESQIEEKEQKST